MCRYEQQGTIAPQPAKYVPEATVTPPTFDDNNYYCNCLASCKVIGVRMEHNIGGKLSG